MWCESQFEVFLTNHPLNSPGGSHRSSEKVLLGPISGGVHLRRWPGGKAIRWLLYIVGRMCTVRRDEFRKWLAASHLSTLQQDPNTKFGCLSVVPSGLRRKRCTSNARFRVLFCWEGRWVRNDLPKYLLGPLQAGSFTLKFSVWLEYICTEYFECDLGEQEHFMHKCKYCSFLHHVESTIHTPYENRNIMGTGECMLTSKTGF